MSFNASHILDVLTQVYGLPRDLFHIASTDQIQFTEKKIGIDLIRVLDYPHLQDRPMGKNWMLMEDLWMTKQAIIASKISWLAGEHEKINARTCSVHLLPKTQAQVFLEQYHLMGYAQSQFHYGLVHQKQLVAVASFSKGRKMNRLPKDELSFELVRYACLPFITITGGLTKLRDAFSNDHQPGDIMTYIDKWMGEKKAFEKIGFVLQGESPPVPLYVNTQTFERYFKEPPNQKILTFKNAGNYKLIWVRS